MEGETAVATLGVSFAGRPDTLLKQGNGMYAMEDGGNLPDANGIAGVTYSMQQGLSGRLQRRCRAHNDRYANRIPCIRGEPKNSASL